MVDYFTSHDLDVILDAHSPEAGSTRPAAAIATARDLFAAARRCVPAYAELAKEEDAKEQDAHGGDELTGVPYTTKARDPRGVGADTSRTLTLATRSCKPRRLPAPRLYATATAAPPQGNYFNAHPLASRCWGGSLAGADFVHFSSGSTGRPTPWARCADDEAEVAARFEQARRGAERLSPHRRGGPWAMAGTSGDPALPVGRRSPGRGGQSGNSSNRRGSPPARDFEPTPRPAPGAAGLILLRRA
jgi:hypothetical protein